MWRVTLILLLLLPPLAIAWGHDTWSSILLIGWTMLITIAAWCLYNVFVRRLPEYSGPDNRFVLLLGGFGIAPSLIAFGRHLLALACGGPSNEEDS